MRQLSFDSLNVSVLRHADPADRRLLFGLIGEFFADPVLRREFGRPMSSTPEYTWLIALDGEAVAGFAAVHVAKNGSAELCHAYTLPAYRRKGWNTWTIGQRCSLAAEQGAKKVYTTIDPQRAASYERLGFRKDIQKGRWLVMWKKLT